MEKRLTRGLISSVCLLAALGATRGWRASAEGSHRALPPEVLSRGLAGPVSHEPLDETFGGEERVTLVGYEGDAMEPFVSRDGSLLLFNDRNQAPNDTKLHWASRVDDTTFSYRGPVEGVNTPAIEGTPSLDRDGNLYFVSTRSYDDTLQTVYRGLFASGAATGVALVSGTSRLVPGWVVFDVEVSADGDTLVLSEGFFDGGAAPRSASLVVARRNGPAFERPADQSEVANLRSDGLDYAAGLSADGLEIFFTRLPPGPGSLPSLFVASRAAAGEPFGMPRRIAAATGFVEAPTLSPDGRSLYYHRLDGSRFVLCRLTRAGPP